MTASPAIPILHKAIEVLQAVAEDGGARTQARLALQLSLAPSTCHRILKTFTAVNWLRAMPSGGYEISLGLLPVVRSLGRCLITHYQTPIIIGDVLIKPGDVVLRDIDGVVIVPREIAFEVLVRAEEIKANENMIFGWVAEGKTVQEITKRGGYF